MIRTKTPRLSTAYSSISEEALQGYLDRPLDDYRVCKRLSLEQLDAMLAKLKAPVPLWKQMRQDQKVCFMIGARTRRFYFGNDTGMGKTLVAVALARYFEAIGEVRRVLVLVPNRSNKFEFAKIARKHDPEITVTVLDAASSKLKWRQLQAEPSLLIVETYAGLTRMLTVKAEGELIVYQAAYVAMRDAVQGLILDEITESGKQGTLSFRTLAGLSRSCAFAFGLSGTPFGKTPEPLWHQFYLLDQGETLGKTLTLFRAAFFSARENPYSGWGWLYTFRKRSKQVLHRMLAHRFLRYRARKSSLPREQHQLLGCSFAKGAEPYFREMRERIYAAHGNAMLIGQNFMRMRQLSSGFLGFREDGEKMEVQFPDNPKLELLGGLLASICNEDELEEEQGLNKVIVFHEFHVSGRLIMQELAQRKLKGVLLNGLTPHPGKVIDQFVDDPRCKVLAINSRSGAFGLDRVKVAQYGIFFESPTSPKTRQQAERRIQRQYSEHDTVFIYDLVTEGTWDRDILEGIQEGRDLLQDIIDGKVEREQAEVAGQMMRLTSTADWRN
jgi:hypothetical protein